MANHDVQVSIQGSTGLPKDRYVHTLHFEGDTWGAGLADELWSKWQTLRAACLGDYAIGKHRISAYTPGANPGGPYFTKEYTLGVASTSAGPAEVACCLSYATVDDPERSLPRRRGRIYLGPIASSLVNNTRPPTTVKDAVLAYGQGIAQVGLASNVTWSMYSATDDAYAKIESIWVDDAWDTQRRRGWAPTARTVQDVQ